MQAKPVGVQARRTLGGWPGASCSRSCVAWQARPQVTGLYAGSSLQNRSMLMEALRPLPMLSPLMGARSRQLHVTAAAATEAPTESFQYQAEVRTPLRLLCSLQPCLHFWLYNCVLPCLVQLCLRLRIFLRAAHWPVLVDN